MCDFKSLFSEDLSTMIYLREEPLCFQLPILLYKISSTFLKLEFDIKYYYIILDTSMGQHLHKYSLLCDPGNILDMSSHKYGCVFLQVNICFLWKMFNWGSNDNTAINQKTSYISNLNLILHYFAH